MKQTMDGKPTDILYRIKWKPVLALAFVLLIVAYILFGGQGIKAPFQETWKGEGTIQEMSWADPSSVELDGNARAKVEVRNNGKEAEDVKIRLTAYDKSLIFPDSDSPQEINATINLGPKEMRELSFDVDFNATYAGKYGIKVTVSPGGENILDEIFFDVKEKKP